MDTLVVIKENEEELPEQIQAFVHDLNQLRDEGFVKFVEDPNGNVRVYPTGE